MSINFIKVAQAAARLDQQGKYEEADALLQSMRREAQGYFGQFGTDVGNVATNVGNFSWNTSPFGSTVNTLKSAGEAVNAIFNQTIDARVAAQLGTDVETLNFWATQPLDAALQFYMHTKNLSSKSAIKAIWNRKGVDIDAMALSKTTSTQNLPNNSTQSRQPSQPAAAKPTNYFALANIDPKQYSGTAEQNDALLRALNVPGAKTFFDAYTAKFGTFDIRPIDRVTRLNGGVTPQ